APDWSTVAREVLCPLCEYNLRGLVQNRCPECGYEFAWEEVLHPEVVRHPWLFEHNPRRNIKSFFRTLLGGLLPRKFWASVRATHRPDRRRLLIYWILAVVIVAATPLVMLVRESFMLSQD